jgi:FkbM family methyltransferase
MINSPKHLITFAARKIRAINPTLYSKVLRQLNLANVPIENNQTTSEASNRYIHVHSRWPDNWKSFFSDNYTALPILRNKLKFNLDSESALLVDRVLELHQMILMTTAYQNDVKYSESILFDPNDLLIRKEVAATVQKAKEKYYLPIDKYEETVFFFHCGLYFLQEIVDIECFLKNKIIVDGGGFIGDSALIFNEIDCHKVIVFEPDPKNLELLEKALEKNQVSRKKVLVEKIGLGALDQTGRLIQNKSGSSFYNETTWSRNFSSVDVPVAKLDTYFSESNIERQQVGLIKLDIQGLELEAVQGALETIRKHRPLLAISVYHTAKDFFGVKALIDEKIGGYRLLIRKTNPFHPIHELMLIGYPEETKAK